MTTIKFRRDTSANWTSVNPIPAQGEPCYETDTGKLKIGNGSDNYVALPYVSDGGGSSGDIPIATTTTAGKVKPDGTTITITDDGTISAVGGSGGGATIDDTTITTTSAWSSSKTNTEITTVANEVVQVQGDVSSLDSDVSTLKTDVSGIKTDVSGLKTDVSGLKTSKQNTLVSGTNIKTINGETILGEGDITVGGSAGTTDYAQLENKPQINSVELTGNKTLDDLGIQAKGNYLTALPDNAVTTDTTQEITGDKTFTGSITTANITCNNTLMASTIRTKANGTIKLAHPTNNASGMITLDNNYGQFSISSSLTGDNNLLGVTRGTAYARIMGNKIETKDKDGNLYNYINSRNIANCILEVPQRIKLELNDGTLTLKAGSQVIIPNGFETDGTTPKFDYVNIESGVTYTRTDNNQALIYFNPSNNNIDGFALNMVTSGATPPTNITTTYWLWYDTENNLVKKTGNNGSTWENAGSLPIGLITVSNGAISSIDQVFNGMGYIGSTTWVDKGVKGLIPNGRNEDGSLSNVEITTNKITLKNYNSYSADEYRTLFLASDFKFFETISFTSGSLANRPVTVSTPKTIFYYCEDENVMYYTTGSTTANWRVLRVMPIGNFHVTSKGEITSFNLKQPFRAVDYNDKSEIGGWGMPSNRYIDLSLGASGATYTAPANGYAYLSRTATASGQYVALSSTIATKTISTTKNQSLEVFIPVKKGNSFTVDYTAATLGTFRFVYAEGEV